jgi:hypothetical protein
MHQALERTLKHRQHIAELEKGIVKKGINKPFEQPILFSGLKGQLMGGSIEKEFHPNNYITNTIDYYHSHPKKIPLPDLTFRPDTLAIGSLKGVNYSIASQLMKNQKLDIPKAEPIYEPEYNSNSEEEEEESGLEYISPEDANMGIGELEKKIRKQQSKKYKEDANLHPAVRNKRMERLQRKNELELEEPEEYNLENLYGSGRRRLRRRRGGRIGLPKPRTK